MNPTAEKREYTALINGTSMPAFRKRSLILRFNDLIDKLEAATTNHTLKKFMEENSEIVGDHNTGEEMINIHIVFDYIDNREK